MSETIIRPRIRVPAGSAALLTTTALGTIQFRGIGAGGKKPAADDDTDEAAKAKRAEEEEAARKAEEEEDAKKAAERKKARNRAKRNGEHTEPDEDDEEGDDDTDREDMAAASPNRAASMRARSRIAAILESPEAAANLEFAVKLALTTDMTRSQAISLLQSAPKAGGGSLANRMAEYGNLRPGAGGAPRPTGQAAIDTQWDQVGTALGIAAPRRA